MDEKRLEELHMFAFELVMDRCWMEVCRHPDELAALLACAQEMVTDGCRHLPVSQHEQFIKQILEYTETNRLRNTSEGAN